MKKDFGHFLLDFLVYLLSSKYFFKNTLNNYIITVLIIMTPAIHQFDAKKVFDQQSIYIEHLRVDFV